MTSRSLIAVLLPVLLGCQANPPYEAKSLHFDAQVAQAWIVESEGAVIPRGAMLSFRPTEVPEAQGRVNPPLARLGVSGQGHTIEQERAYHVAAPGVTPSEFDAYLVELNGRELLGMPLLNDQRHQAGTAGIAGQTLTLQQLALFERTGDTMILRFPRHILAWMPWPNFPSNSHEAEEDLFRPLARREGVTNSFSYFLDLYRAHMNEPDFWGEPIVLKLRPANSSPQ
jgi:hypothetical protein